MARPREFDLEKVLDSALSVFWRHGYENASLPILLDEMGLSRGSFYKAFHDKQSLFLLVLEKYENEAVDPAVKLLSDPETQNGLERIEKLFTMVAEEGLKDVRRGCLLCLAIASPTVLEKDVSDKVHELLERMRTGFAQALVDTNMSDNHTGQLTEFLLSQYVALRVLARAGEPYEALHNSMKASINLLRSLEVSSS